MFDICILCLYFVVFVGTRLHKVDDLYLILSAVFIMVILCVCNNLLVGELGVQVTFLAFYTFQCC